MDRYVKTNRDYWNDVVPVHVNSAMYDVESFRAGKSTLRSVEREALGDVVGKSLLHLQCHFGMDTMSWARLGAKVIGVDVSDAAIEAARLLANELGIDAEFVCSDIDGLQGVLDGEYDIVFTSYGVIPWLPDLTRWAQTIAHFLKPGGTFFLAEEHPAWWIFETDGANGSLTYTYPYFSSPEPSVYEGDGSSYADANARVEHKVTCEWSHSLGEIINSLIGAGLTIERLDEYPFCMYQRFPCMTKGEDGWWRLPEEYGDMPMLIGLRARKG